MQVRKIANIRKISICTIDLGGVGLRVAAKNNCFSVDFPFSGNFQETFPDETATTSGSLSQNLSAE